MRLPACIKAFVDKGCFGQKNDLQKLYQCILDKDPRHNELVI